MQGYREVPPTLPLVTHFSGHIIAVDPETGALRWTFDGTKVITSVLVHGANAFVATKTPRASPFRKDYGTVRVLDLATGVERGAIPLEFYPERGLIRGDRLYFVGWNGVVALTSEGHMLFELVRSEPTKKSLGEIVGHDATGRAIWRIPAADTIERVPVWMALGELVAQPDFTD